MQNKKIIRYFSLLHNAASLPALFSKRVMLVRCIHLQKLAPLSQIPCLPSSTPKARDSLFQFLSMAVASSPLRCSSPYSTSSPVNAQKKVGTHNGSFHCDEALGCFMIRLTEKFDAAEIVRTRDSQVVFLVLVTAGIMFALLT